MQTGRPMNEDKQRQHEVAESLLYNYNADWPESAACAHSIKTSSHLMHPNHSNSTRLFIICNLSTMQHMPDARITHSFFVLSLSGLFLLRVIGLFW